MEIQPEIRLDFRSLRAISLAYGRHKNLLPAAIGQLRKYEYKLDKDV